MGGKKKQSLANKLAKMSDEERARYLQQKADAEEEARRRKEQLIAIFMKNKIKKEDAFSRLNLAKINQEWHQILRKAKCKEMKENVGHLKTWIERVMTLKTRTIDNLMTELDEAEFQYSHNFQTHISHVQNIIAEHQEYMNRMHEQYENDSREIFGILAKETEETKQKANDNEAYLKTIIFGLDEKMKEDLKANQEKFMNDYDDVISSQHLELETLTKSREAVSAAIWREIASILRDHVHRTDQRRLHLAELKRLDAESAAEIAENQERITKAEFEVLHLKKLNLATREKLDNQLARAKQGLNLVQKTFRAVRDQLQVELKLDERKLALMTATSNKTLEYLKTARNKGRQISALAEICSKYETEQEKVTKWFTMQQQRTEGEEEIDGVETIEVAESEISTPDTDKVLSMLRPKTSKPKTRPCSLRKSVPLALMNKIQPERSIDKIILASKGSHPSKMEDVQNGGGATSQSASKSKFIEETCKPLFDLEGMWIVQSRVKVELMDMKKEKEALNRENEQLKELLRNVLEAAVLKRSAPTSRISSGIVSQKLRHRSAPPRSYT